MVVKREDYDFRMSLTQIEAAVARSIAADRPDAADQQIETLLGEISRDTVALNDKIIAAVRCLAGRNAWCATVRLLIGVGGYQSSEIAEAVGVMRSTVTRWYNGETAPQPSQLATYFERLLSYMKETRPFDLHIDIETLIRR